MLNAWTTYLIGVALSVLFCGCGEPDEDLVHVSSGTYIAESESDYIKLVSIESKKDFVGSVALLHHQLPITNLKDGLGTQLRLTQSGGHVDRGPSFPKDAPFPGYSHAVMGSEVFSNTNFYPVDSGRIRYRVELLGKHRKLIEAREGYLKKSNSNGVLSFLSKAVADLTGRGINATVAAYNETISLHENLKIDEDYCQTHFLNSCRDLIDIGLLAKQASSLSIDQDQPPAGQNVEYGNETPRGQSGDGDSGLNPSKGGAGGGSLEAPVQLSPQLPSVNIGSLGDGKGKPYPYLDLTEEIDIESVIDASTVVCENLDECPEHAALLIGYDGRSAFQCSTSYLGTGYFATNSHCLPGNLIVGNRATKTLCEGALWVKFPATGSAQEELHSCERIEMVTVLNENRTHGESRDMLIFKVKGKVNRKPLLIAWDAAPPFNQRLTFWPADPDPSRPGIHGTIRKNSCKVTDARSLEPLLKHFGWNYPVSYLTQCEREIIKGNSGSSAVSTSGQGLALISHTSDKLSGRSSNYSCANVQLTEKGLTERSLSDCQWIEDNSRAQLTRDMNEQKKQALTEEFISFYRALFKMQDEFVNEIESAFDARLSKAFQRQRTKLMDLPVEDSELQDAVNMDSFIREFTALRITSYELEQSSPIEYTASNSNKFTLTKELLLNRTGVQVRFVSVPKCIERLSPDTIALYRTDQWWNPFSDESYRVIKLLVPAGNLYLLEWKNAPDRIAWNELDQLRLENTTEEIIPLATTFELTISNYYDTQTGQLAKPLVIVRDVTTLSGKDGASLQDFELYKKTESALKSLQFCDE